jgi:hypothetical protein
MRAHGGQRLILKRQLRINGSRGGIRGRHTIRDVRDAICRDGRGDHGGHATICHDGRSGRDAMPKLPWM